MAWQHARIYYLVAHLRWVIRRLSRTHASIFKALYQKESELEDTVTAEVQNHPARLEAVCRPARKMRERKSRSHLSNHTLRFPILMAAGSPGRPSLR